jgi:hypothetical protein
VPRREEVVVVQLAVCAPLLVREPALYRHSQYPVPRWQQSKHASCNLQIVYVVENGGEGSRFEG